MTNHGSFAEINEEVTEPVIFYQTGRIKGMSFEFTQLLFELTVKHFTGIIKVLLSE